MTNQTWLTFLEQQGAHFSTEDPQCWAHFDAAGQDKALKLLPLTQYDLVEIIGSDAQKFLQGQLTCDVGQLQPGSWQSGAACTPQGRVYSNFELALTCDETPTYLMRLPRDGIDTLITQLSKYIVFYKSELRHRSKQWAGFEIIGAGAVEALSQALEADSTALFETPQIDKGIIRASTDDPASLECWLALELTQKIWPKLLQQSTLTDSQQRALMAIRAGYVDIQPGSTEAYTPEVLNLTNRAVSFKKGCYTGQEIVARMHYKGTAKSGLVHLTFTQALKLPIGTVLNCKESGQKLTILNLAANEEGKTEALAIAPVALFESEQLTLSNENNSYAVRLMAFDKN